MMLFTLQRYEFFSKSQPNQTANKTNGRCCLPYKGTNFSANHNCFVIKKKLLSDVVYPTKVRIFQQITTSATSSCRGKRMLFTLQRYEFFSKSQLEQLFADDDYRCCLPYKGTNFSANHNSNQWDAIVDLMLFTLQRYEFFSKSQRFQSILRLCARCCLPYKGTNFSANHNISYKFMLREADVVYPTKVRIFQQITTIDGIFNFVFMMLFTLQRYEFFSKSQQICCKGTDIFWCCLPYKGTNFSANHNRLPNAI